MNESIKKIQQRIEPLRQQIIKHQVYASIKDVEDLKIFMQYHVYAVWDFMSLLKSLQNNLTCTTVPWFPIGSAETRYFINEIVVGEESDIDSFGIRKSHFEIYIDAMQQCKADTTQIQQFIATLQNTQNLETAFLDSNTPQEAQNFVNFTFQIIHSKKAFLQAAIFTFGREDLIPAMFLSIVNDIHQQLPDCVSIFKYYLERHIEVDGGHHSALAIQMVKNLCGNDEKLWQEVEEAVVMSLQQRIQLWNGAYEQIKQKQQVIVT